MEEKNTDALPEDMDIDINSDAEIPGSTHLTNPEAGTEHPVEKLEEELREQKDKYLRLVAEFDNYRRRTAREKIDLIQTAGKNIITDLLEVLDDWDRAETVMDQTEDLEQVKQGNQLVFNKLRNILSQQGLTSMESLDTDFDVEKHEAITQLDAGKEMKGKVVDVLQKGYYLNDKIIRFAKVVVGK